MELDGIKTACLFSNEKIGVLRDKLQSIVGPESNICVVTVGSLARREASAQSDIDFFVIVDGDESNAKDRYQDIEAVLGSVGLRPPSSTGAFGQLVQYGTLLENIGGLEDRTETLTRRMLLLLECEWLSNESLFNRLFEESVNKYVRKGITQHQLCRFFLNDLIRYYRTICVDFEFKTSIQGKSWGDRNVKLLFSRKLLYFSGVLTVAETVQHTCEAKREMLKEMLRLTPIERIHKVCGPQATPALKSYSDFLEQLSIDEVRELLNKTSSDRNEHCEDFRLLKNKGHHFSWQLAKLLESTYPATHPIRQALIF